MFPVVPETSMDDVGSLEDVKQNLTHLLVDPIIYKQLHEKFNARRPTGVLMWGPPGCGKTLLAKAIANFACLNLLPISGPQLLNMYQGESERAIRDTFQKARTVAPCIIFFDEFDAICPVRSNRSESGSKATVVNTLLAEMNGITQRGDVYVIAATNRPDTLDPAITRPGRFDTTLYVGLPDLKGRESILNAITKKGKIPKIAEDVKIEEIAQRCQDFSGADLSWLVYTASKEAIAEIKNHPDFKQNNINSVNEDYVVSLKNFNSALKRVQPSISYKQRQHYEKLKKKLESSKKFIENVEETEEQMITN